MPLLVVRSAAEAKAHILDHAPDLCFVNGWYWLFDHETLNAASGGFVGVHNSLLPAYRGAAPLVWALINGEKEVGSSIFYMGDGMDEGDVLKQVRVTVGPDDRIGDVLERLEEGVLAELPSVWKALLDGSAVATPQAHHQASYCGPRQPSDGLINWCLPAYAVHNFIRAQSDPYPGAFTVLDGRTISILEAHPIDVRYAGTPGQVLRLNGAVVLVSCGENTALAVRTVRVDGTSMPAAKVLKSIRIRLLSHH